MTTGAPKYMKTSFQEKSTHESAQPVLHLVDSRRIRSRSALKYMLYENGYFGLESDKANITDCLERKELFRKKRSSGLHRVKLATEPEQTELAMLTMVSQKT